MWNKIEKYIDKVILFINGIKDKLNKDPLGRQKKLYLIFITWYILGVITFKGHPTIFLFLVMCFVVYDNLFNKPRL